MYAALELFVPGAVLNLGDSLLLLLGVVGETVLLPPPTGASTQVWSISSVSDGAAMLLLFGPVGSGRVEGVDGLYVGYCGVSDDGEGPLPGDTDGDGSTGFG